MDCWKLGQYAREAPLYAYPVITSSLGIQYLTTFKNHIQARRILPFLKKCLRGLKMASTNKSICADVCTCVVYCGQWACPRKPNGYLTEFDATTMPSSMNDFILDGRMKSWRCWNQQEIWHCPQWKQDLTSGYLSPKAQVLPDTLGFLLVTAWIFSMKWSRDFQSTELRSMLLNTTFRDEFKNYRTSY